MNEDTWKSLVEAVYAWLCFKVACGQRRLLNEASLSEPITQWVLGVGRDTLAREHNAVTRAGRGRPPQIDYVLKDREGRPWAFIETKYSRLSAGELLPDCKKLLDQRNTSHRYLLVAGIWDMSPTDYLRNTVQFLPTTPESGWQTFDRTPSGGLGGASSSKTARASPSKADRE